jgi:DNA repair ATPase RecN
MTTVVPNIKNKNVTDEDLTISSEILTDIEKLSELFEAAEDKVKNALGKHVDKINSYKPKVEKIKSAIEKILPTLSEVVDTVVDSVEEIIDDIANLFTSSPEAEEALNGQREKMNDDALQGVIKTATSFLSNLVTDGDKVTPETARIQRTESQSLLANINNLIDNVTDAVKETANDVVKGIEDAIKAATDAEVNSTSTDDLVSDGTINPIDVFVNDHI